MSTLLLFALLGIVFERHRFSLQRAPENMQHPKWVRSQFTPSAAFLGTLRDEITKREHQPQRTAWRIARLVEPENYERVKKCCASFMRFHHAKSGKDVFQLRRCYDWLCPTCADVQHFRRWTYIARKIASLNPAKDPLPQVVNVVFTLPPVLAAWLREDPRVHAPWRHAIRRTLARAYRYEGRHGASFERACWQEMGAVMTLHAWGSESWPKSHPHYDILIPAWKRKGEKIKPLRKTWPEKYEHTRAKYREELRAALLPLTRSGLPRVDVIELFKTDFDVDWHVSLPPRTWGEAKNRVIHTRSAMHRIRYNLRPMWHGGHAWIDSYPDKERPVLVYELDTTTRTSRGPLRRVPLGPAISILRNLKPFLTGKETRHQIGIMSRVSYTEACALAGHTPVREREDRGLTLKAQYKEDEHGRFDPRPERAFVQAKEADERGGDAD